MGNRDFRSIHLRFQVMQEIGIIEDSSQNFFVMTHVRISSKKIQIPRFGEMSNVVKAILQQASDVIYNS